MEYFSLGGNNSVTRMKVRQRNTVKYDLSLSMKQQNSVIRKYPWISFRCILQTL